MALKRMALAVGLGYVLGAKAGRDRYDELVDLWRKVNDSPAFKRLSESAKRTTVSAQERVGQALETVGGSNGGGGDRSARDRVGVAAKRLLGAARERGRVA